MKRLRFIGLMGDCDVSMQPHASRRSPTPNGITQPAFREVYLAHFDFVWRTLRRQGVREQDAADVTQKVFIVVYLKLAAFENRSSLRTWLFRVCLYAASDYRRAAPVRYEVATEPDEIVLLSGLEEDLHHDTESHRRALVAEGILNKLPEAQRSVFVLFELEDMSASEIAELLGIATGTVRSRLRLAREVFAREARRVSARDTWASFASRPSKLKSTSLPDSTNHQFPGAQPK